MWGFYHYTKKHHRCIRTLIDKLINSFRKSELQLDQFNRGFITLPTLTYEYRFSQALKKAINLVTTNKVKKFTYAYTQQTDPMDFDVESESNPKVSYTVQVDNGSCDCPHAIAYGSPCKHLLAVLLYLKQVHCVRHTIPKAQMVDAINTIANHVPLPEIENQSEEQVEVFIPHEQEQEEEQEQEQEQEEQLLLQQQQEEHELLVVPIIPPILTSSSASNNNSEIKSHEQEQGSASIYKYKYQTRRTNPNLNLGDSVKNRSTNYMFEKISNSEK